MDKSKLIHVGNVFVDAGIVMVGDPCYHVGKKITWGDFLDKTFPAGEDYNKQAVEALGKRGLGIVVSSGFGDGEYPVFIEEVDIPGWGRRVKRLVVEFISDEECDGD